MPAYSLHTAFNWDSTEAFRSNSTLADSGYLTSDRNLVYESEPLPQDAEIFDFIRVQLFMSLTTPDADFEVNLYESTPDGKSFPLGSCVLRARYRNSLQQEELVKPGEINWYTFDTFRFLSKKLLKGSRLRLVVENLNSP